MDFPGQYRRRIKSVTITLPGVSSPTVAGRLTLVQHSYRTNTTNDSFQTDTIPIPSVVISDPSGDTGTSLDSTANSYLPFEGAGAISKWSIDLSPYSQVDPSDITDVAMTMRYTASNGTEALRRNAMATVDKLLQATVAESQAGGLFASIDLSVDLASDRWKTFAAASTAPRSRTLNLAGLDDKLPFFCRASRNGLSPSLKSLYLIVNNMVIPDTAPIKLVLNSGSSKTSISLAVLQPQQPTDGSGLVSKSLALWGMTEDVNTSIGDGSRFSIQVDGVSKEIPPVTMLVKFTMQKSGNVVAAKK
jgi:hypothetical protein